MIQDLIITLLAAFIGGMIFRKLNLPLLLGYLLGGVAAAQVFGRFFFASGTVGSIAEIGVSFLLFTIGLEFSITKLKNLGEVIILGSLVQVFACIVIFILIFSLLGVDFYSALFLASVFSLSSTALVLKLLSDRGELETLHGEMASGWLFMQDIYTLPLIILLPTISKLTQNISPGFPPVLNFAGSIIVALLSFFLIIFAGRTLIPKVIEKIADFKSRELLLIAAVSLCLVFAYIFQILGLSFALGAFVAGILLSSSSANHGIFAEVRPLRDLFSSVFFVSLGLLMDPSFFISHTGIILLFSVLVIGIKYLVSLLLVLALGYHTKTAALVSFSLISVGEFAFILALLGLSSNLINKEIYLTILSVSFVSFIASVPILSKGEKIYYKAKQILSRFSYVKNLFNTLDKSTEGLEVLKDHIVVLGHGRVGKYICHALSHAQIPYIVIDYNHKLVKNLRRAGVKVIYGDPADIDVLRFANVEDAKVVILAYADRHTQEAVVANILTVNPSVKLIARAHFEEDRKLLKGLGVNTVIQPEFEAAISMTHELLKIVNLEKSEIESRIRSLQKEYRLN